MGATRPRILGWRSIVLALVVGVVLAVVSVPVAAVVGALPPMSAVATTRRGHFYDDGHLILFDRAWNPASER